VNMRWFASIQGYEEETVGTYPEDSRHPIAILFIVEVSTLR
jgi:hypothetical protein